MIFLYIYLFSALIASACILIQNILMGKDSPLEKIIFFHYLSGEDVARLFVVFCPILNTIYALYGPYANWKIYQERK